MKNKSFTLIELLVVIVIIGILAGVIMASTSSSIDKASFAKAQAFSSTVQNELLLNLVSEWTFDEGNANDSWGVNDGGVTGANYNTENTGNCVFGGCYDFESGNYDYIDCGNDVSLNIIDKISISAWVRLSDLNTGRIVHKGGQTNNYLDYSLLVGDSGRISFGASKTIDNIIRVRDVDYLKTSIWYYIVGTFDGVDNKIYLNGVEREVVDSTLSNSAISNLNIGRRNDNAQYLNGLLDDTRIYNAVMSSSQIKQNYVAGLDSLLLQGSISKKDYNQRIRALAYNKHE